jgi:hypothetical protein
MNLKSSVTQKGRWVTEIITMIGGYKKTFRYVDSESIEQGEFTHFNTKDGRLVLVNTKNVLFVEVFEEEGEKK